MGAKRRNAGTSGIMGKIRRAVPWLKGYHLVAMLILGILLAHGFMISRWLDQTELSGQLQARKDAAQLDLDERTGQLDAKIADAKHDLTMEEKSLLTMEEKSLMLKQQLQVDFQEAGKQLANIRRLVPNYVDNTKFTTWLLALAKENDVTVSNLTHRPSSLQQVGERDYLIMGFNLNATGTSSDLVAFVAALERADRQLLVVKSTQYSASKQGGELSVELAVYTLPGTQQSGSLAAGGEGGFGSIMINVITEEEEGVDNLPGSFGQGSPANTGEGSAVTGQEFLFSPSYSRPFGVKKFDIPEPSQPLPPGIYTINYNVPRGWDMVESTCDDGIPGGDSFPAGAIFLAGGKVITCTFRYARRGFIFVDVETTPRDPQEFQFASDYGDSFTLTQVDGAFSSLPLVKGRYSLDHAVPAGWDLDLVNTSCDDGSPVDDIDLGPGEVITCTYHFDKQGHILVEVETLPEDSSQEFSLQTNFDEDEDEFSLRHGGIRHESESLVPGKTYSVKSLGSPAGWDLASASCDDGSEVDDITLQPGEVVNCTFTYAKRGYILARVKVITDDPPNSKSYDQKFNILPDYGKQFTLTHSGARHDSQSLKPGPYKLVVSEVPENWKLTKATCDDGSSITTIEDDGSSILSIELEPDEIVYCTFRYSNRR